MPMVNLLLRVALLKGPVWHRIYLAVFFTILLDYAVVFAVFFSLRPGPASAMSSTMDRSLFLVAPAVIASCVFMFPAWFFTHIVVAVMAYQRKLTEPLGVIYAVLPVLAFFVLRTVYSAFLSGHGTAIHVWFYELPKVVSLPRIPFMALLAAPVLMAMCIVAVVIAWLLRDAPEEPLCDAEENADRS